MVSLTCNQMNLYLCSFHYLLYMLWSCVELSSFLTSSARDLTVDPLLLPRKQIRNESHASANASRKAAMWYNPLIRNSVTEKWASGVFFVMLRSIKNSMINKITVTVSITFGFIYFLSYFKRVLIFMFRGCCLMWYSSFNACERVKSFTEQTNFTGSLVRV